MAKGEIIQFSGDEAGCFHVTNGQLPASPPVRRTGEPLEFEPLGEIVLAVVLRLQSELPRVRVERMQAGDDLHPPRP